ncbi:oxygenase MpaB family protein [soil metagenome]
MSVFTDVAAEGILLAGGGRAILLQIADPAVGTGVAQHSDFAHRPVDRLNSTVAYAYATVFASEVELAAIVERVNRAHGPVNSPPHGDNPGYNAFDAPSQLWVAATLYHTALDVYERVFGPLDAQAAEQVYRQYRVLGTTLQVPETLWPVDLEAFRHYWRSAVEALDVTDDARRVAHDLLHPRTAPLWLRAAMPVARLVTTGLLPAELRTSFALPWSTTDQRRFDRLFRVAARLYPRVPRRIRTLPRDRSMKRLRKMVA